MTSINNALAMQAISQSDVTSKNSNVLASKSLIDTNHTASADTWRMLKAESAIIHDTWD